MPFLAAAPAAAAPLAAFAAFAAFLSCPAVAVAVPLAAAMKEQSLVVWVDAEGIGQFLSLTSCGTGLVLPLLGNTRQHQGCGVLDGADLVHRDITGGQGGDITGSSCQEQNDASEVLHDDFCWW